MKNRIIIIVSIVIILITTSIEKVEARLTNLPIADGGGGNACAGNEYACAICKYSIDNNGSNKANHGTITYILKSDGVKVSKTLQEKFVKNTAALRNDNLSSVNFIVDSTNKLRCPAKLDVGMQPGQNYRTTYFDFYLAEKCEASSTQNYACISGNLIKEDSYNNDKVIKQKNDDVISCQYQTSIINGQQSSEKVIGYINVVDGKVEYEFTGGYVANNNMEKIPANKFTKDSCPSLYFTCANYDGYKACSFELENVIRPGTEQEGSKTETADKEPAEEEKTEEKEPFKAVCGIFGEHSWKYVQTFYDIIRIAIPALIILLGMLDFIKVLFSGEEKDMKAAGQKFAKRIIAGVVFLLLPVLLDFIFGIVGFSEDCLGKFID